MFSLLLALILTTQAPSPPPIPVNHEEQTTWSTVGELAGFCGYWQHLYELQRHVESLDATLQLIEADGTVTDISTDPGGQWYCKLEFTEEPIASGDLEYWVTLNFVFTTEESREFFPIAIDVSMTFCTVIPDTPVWGVVTVTTPDGRTERHECEGQEL